MTDDLGLRLGQLLCSRLCHDLAGPVSAVANGLELVQDGPDPEALALAVDSAAAVARRLAYFRLAFGTAGDADLLDPRQVVEAGQGLVVGSRVTLDWPLPEPLEGWPGGAARLALLVVLIGVEALPRGGRLALEARPGHPPVLVAEGRNAGLRRDLAEALTGPVDAGQLDARSAVGALARLIADRQGLEVAVTAPGAESLRIAFPRRGNDGRQPVQPLS